MRESNCGFYIKHIYDALQRDANNALRGQELTMMQITVLLQLDHAPEKTLSLKDLERRLHVAQSTMAGIIIRLEQKGFVESLGNLRDKRVKIVRITRDGIACCEASQRYMRDAETQLLSSLTTEEQTVFVTLLKKVSGSIR